MIRRFAPTTLLAVLVAAGACKSTEESVTVDSGEAETGGAGGARAGGATGRVGTGGSGGTSTGSGGASSGGASGGGGSASGGSGGSSTGGASGASGSGGSGGGAAADAPVAADKPASSDAGSGTTGDRVSALGDAGVPLAGRPHIRLCAKEWSQAQCCQFLCACLNERCTDAPRALPGIPTCMSTCMGLSDMLMRCHVYHCFEARGPEFKDHESHCAHAANTLNGGGCPTGVY
jgi:hypothetical protein